MDDDRKKDINEEKPSARDIWHEKLKNSDGKKTGVDDAAEKDSYTYRYAYEKDAGRGADIPIGDSKETLVFKAKKKLNKPVVIFVCIVAVFILAALILRISGAGTGSEVEAAGASGEHIGVVHIEGTIGEDSETYNQQYIVDTISAMIENDDNKAMILYVNTPGGGVYESDEIYMKVKEYQETTGRPVYSYMASQATSGGYYISAPADKIIANRNCWTGSIGVTMGTIFDISGLLEKYGISTETMTSGANKSMGSMTEPLTEEQRNIMQSMIDESYDQFVGIVAEGRNLSEEYVRTIADGRIYTAKQAENLKLIDGITATYDEAVEQMMEDNDLYGCSVYDFKYEEDPGLLGSMIESVEKLASAAEDGSDISAVTKLLEKQNTMEPQYMCEVVK